MLDALIPERLLPVEKHRERRGSFQGPTQDEPLAVGANVEVAIFE